MISYVLPFNINLNSDSICDLLENDQYDNFSVSFEDQGVEVEGVEERIDYTFNDIDSQYDNDLAFELIDNEIKGSERELDDNISDVEGVNNELGDDAIEDAPDEADLWQEWQDNDVSFVSSNIKPRMDSKNHQT